MLNLCYRCIPYVLLAICLVACIRADEPQYQGTVQIAFAETSLNASIDTATVLSLFTNRAVEQTTAIDFQVSGSAVEGIDYELTSQTILFEAGTNEASISILPKESGESKIGKTIILTLTTPSNGIIREGADITTLTFVVSHSVNLDIWAKDDPFPQLFGYTSGNEEPVPPGRGPNAGEHVPFAYKSSTQENVIGLFNPEAGNSTNALNIHRLYADFDVSSGSANIRIPALLRFIPDEPDAKQGTVEVIAQTITVTRTASSGLPPFPLPIEGSGTYNEETGIITLAVYFDETALGGESNVLRRYLYQSERRP
ncbi:MAG: hypothetical protein ACFB0B_05865 [Thermonemataceae bacterium]